jgi:agmatine deiminase
MTPLPFTPGTPAALGYRMPAEFEPHAATWLSWPHKEASWPGMLDHIPPLWVEMAGALVVGERVHILVNTAAPAEQVEKLLRAGGVPLERVRLHEVATDDAWIRDSGPIFVARRVDGLSEAAIVDWEYNAWGGKYPPFDDDNRIPQRVAALLSLERFTPGMVLEGGSIEVNGRGTLLTTEACLLNPNRNPELTRTEIETGLRDYLGVRHILWLGEGIAGDDTDGHVDDLARFVAPNTVVTVLEDDPADPNHAPLRDNYERLRRMTDEEGRPLRVVTLPMPPPVFHKGTRLPASYANFYIGNAVVLVPTFAQPSDAVALATLQELFPDRRVAGIHAADLVWGLGACHCVTQQQPAVERVAINGNR